MLRNPIVITEHQTYVPSKDFDIYSFLAAHNVKLPGIPADYMGTPQCLAIDSTLTASYYIGATWLVERELPVIVLPKIPNIDYLEMFMAALSVDSKHGEEYFSKCYGVVFHRVCLRPVCLRSDDAKLMNNFVFHIKKANFML